MIIAEWGGVTLDELSAREILDAANVAWSEGDVDQMLRNYSDDVVYWCNTGGPDSGPLTITGKAALAEFLRAARAVTESVCVSEYFRLIDGVGRSKVEAFIRHKRTGHTLSGSYRQLVTFRDGKITRVEEFHDAAKFAAFWRLIRGEPAAEHNPVESEPATDL